MPEVFATPPICCDCDQPISEWDDIEWTREHGRCPHCDHPIVLKNEPLGELFECYLNVAGENAWYRHYDRTTDDRAAFLRGMSVALASYAWWKDGTAYVGSTGTTLKTALTAIKDEADRLGRVVVRGGKSNG